MSNETKSGNFLTLENIDEDWLAPNAVRNWEAVKFFPGAVGDYLLIREGSDAGPVITRLISYDGEGRIDREFSSASQPYLDYDNSQLSAGSIVTFVKKITS